MRYIDPPVTEKTLDEYYGNIKRAVDVGCSTLLLFQSGIGGSTAYISYLRDNKNVIENFFSPDSHKTVFVNCISCIDLSTLGFLYNLYTSFVNGRGNELRYRDVSINILLHELKNEFIEVLKTKKIVIFITKYSEIDDSVKRDICRHLFDLWSLSKEKILFVIPLNIDIDFHGEAGALSMFYSMKEALSENIITFKSHKHEDFVFALKRLEVFFKINHNERAFSEIIKLSNGSFGKLKNLAKQYALSNDLDSVIKYAKTYDTGRSSKKYPLIMNDSGYSINGVIISSQLTLTQKTLLALFFKRKGLTVSRDDIANEIWGSEYLEKYSDWAIDRHISDLRHKLANLNCSDNIVAVRGQGYLLSANNLNSNE